MRLGSPAWDILCRIRGARFSTRDLGEAESLAVALAEAARGPLLPFVTYDNPATKQAAQLEVVTLDFLDTLAWLEGCGAVTGEQADAIEATAAAVDGWRRPAGYAGSIDTIGLARRVGTIARVDAWRERVSHGN